MKPGRALQVAAMLAVLASLLLARYFSPMHGTTTDRPAFTTTGGPYDPDPNHIWNRLHDSLLVRRSADGIRDGSDAVDPLLWGNTRFLREHKSRRFALECLDKFLKNHAEKAVTDPTRRSVFQHDLWAVFDWATSRDAHAANDQALLLRLVQVMRRVALTPDQIRTLQQSFTDEAKN